MKMMLAEPKTLPVKNLKRITTYVSPEIYELLKERAAKENRNLSNMAATILAESVKPSADNEPNS